MKKLEKLIDKISKINHKIKDYQFFYKNNKNTDLIAEKVSNEYQDYYVIYHNEKGGIYGKVNPTLIESSDDWKLVLKIPINSWLVVDEFLDNGDHQRTIFKYIGYDNDYIYGKLSMTLDMSNNENEILNYDPDSNIIIKFSNKDFFSSQYYQLDYATTEEIKFVLIEYCLEFGYSEDKSVIDLNDNKTVETITNLKYEDYNKIYYDKRIDSLEVPLKYNNKQYIKIYQKDCWANIINLNQTFRFLKDYYSKNEIIQAYNNTLDHEGIKRNESERFKLIIDTFIEFLISNNK